jgi:hypothetical protein
MIAIQLPASTIAVKRPAPRPAPLTPPISNLSTAETAECTCPDFCERDHANE